MALAYELLAYEVLMCSFTFYLNNILLIVEINSKRLYLVE